MQVCHALLQNAKFHQILLRIDTELAEQTRVVGCLCGGILHRGNYPRKPRCCPFEVYGDFDWRYSFCCSICRKRTTPVSVRFLGRRVYLGLTVVLMSAGRTEATSAVANLSVEINVPALTIQRWRTWWAENFPLTPLWQAACARFMPPVELSLLPASLIQHFKGTAAESMLRFLLFLSPLTVERLVTMNEGC